MAHARTACGERCDGQVVLPNDAAIFRVCLDSPCFPSAEAAMASMDAVEYAQLKALLMSVSYS